MPRLFPQLAQIQPLLRHAAQALVAEIVEAQSLHLGIGTGEAPAVIHLLGVEADQLVIVGGLLRQRAHQLVQGGGGAGGQHHPAGMAVLAVGTFDIAAASGAFDRPDPDIQQLGQPHAGIQRQNADRHHHLAIGRGRCAAPRSGAAPRPGPAIPPEAAAEAGIAAGGRRLRPAGQSA